MIEKASVGVKVGDGERAAHDWSFVAAVASCDDQIDMFLRESCVF